MPTLEILDINSSKYVIRDRVATHQTLSVPYARLKELRDSNQLIAGQKYRILDYDCTTTQAGTRSAGHRFSIIVTADSKCQLNENASATLASVTSQEITDVSTEVEVLATQYIDDVFEENYRLGEYKNSFLRFENNKLYYNKVRDEQDPSAGDGDYLEFVERTFFNGRPAGKWKRVDVSEPDPNNVDKIFLILNCYIDSYTSKLKTYFTDYFNHCNLNAWKLKYCLDNDTTRFAWADPTSNGKGVIYWMRDEFGNEAPYDFKNIQFKRYACDLTAAANPDFKSYTVFDTNTYFPGYWATETFTPSIFTKQNDKYIWAYTFHDAINNTDGTVNWQDQGNATAYNCPQKCYNNIIKEYVTTTSRDSYNSNQTLSLNDIVFYTRFYDDEVTTSTHDNIFGSNCHTMTFSKSCQFNTFGNNNYNILFGNDCTKNIFENDCTTIIFGNNCTHNKLGNACSTTTLAGWCDCNIFEGNCTHNTLANGCGSNTFDSACDANILGADCGLNAFGKACGFNNLGSNCNYNSFEAACSSNKLSMNCTRNKFEANAQDNTLGMYCRGNKFETDAAKNSLGMYSFYNTFGADCNSITATTNYMTHCTFDPNVRFIKLAPQTATSSSVFVQYIHVHTGVKGSSSGSLKTITVPVNRAQEYNIVKTSANAEPVAVG